MRELSLLVFCVADLAVFGYGIFEKGESPWWWLAAFVGAIIFWAMIDGGPEEHEKPASLRAVERNE